MTISQGVISVIKKNEKKKKRKMEQIKGCRMMGRDVILDCKVKEGLSPKPASPSPSTCCSPACALPPTSL